MDPINNFLRKISYKFSKGYPNLENENDVLIIENELNKLGINLNEVKLSPATLEKPYYPNHELHGKYEDRGGRFLDKIQKGDELVLTSGETVTLDKTKSQKAIEALKNKNYSYFSRGAKVLFDSEDNSYSISNFEKTKEFGSGSGSGGGTENTGIQESSQSVVNVIAYNIVKGKISPEDLTEENINKAYSMSDVTASVNECIDFIKNQTQWTDTFVITANILYSNYPNPNLKQHRGSDFVQSIYDAFKIAKKKEGLSLNPDKWNPADIWMVDGSILGMEFPVDLGELNGIIANLFTDKKLIGVSLKKVEASPSLTVYNIDKEDVKGYTYEGADSRETNNNTSIIYNDGTITFRTFNFATNFAGEIKGKSAQHGKIGQGAINDVLKLNSIQTLPPPKQVQTKIKSSDPTFKKEFLESYSNIVKPINEDELEELMEEKDLNWLVSKYLSTTLANIIDNQSQNIQNEIISDIIRYASSKTKVSSVFIKIA